MEAMLIFICLAAIYGGLKIVLERRLAPSEVIGTDGDLKDVAFANGCSVYDLNQRAKQDYHFPQAKIENNFKTYLKKGDIPDICSCASRLNQRIPSTASTAS